MFRASGYVWEFYVSSKKHVHKGVGVRGFRLSQSTSDEGVGHEEDEWNPVSTYRNLEAHREIGPVYRQ